MARLTRFSRTGSMGDLQREVNDLFDQFFPSRRKREEGDEYESAVWAPRVDIAETDSEHVIHVDLPGVSKDDVEVTIDNNVLKISGERKMSRKESDGEYSRVERSYGRFFRSFRLGDQVDAENIAATHENGVLTVRLPKTAETRPHKIEIT